MGPIEAIRTARARAAELIDLQSRLLTVQLEAWHDQLIAGSTGLGRFDHSTYSQDGTDGILSEILRRVGEGDRTFVEFGSGAGVENNTTLLAARGWSGVWIEGDEASIASAREAASSAVDDDRLTICQGFVTAENINHLLDETGVSKVPAVMSIDLDGNDYWVWKAIDRRPRVLAIEYNAAFPPGMAWVMPYDSEHAWSGDNLFGASLAALTGLGVEKGYQLVGCTLAGINAFFVRDDLADGMGGEVADLWERERHLLLRRTGHRHRRALGQATVIP